MSEKNEMMIAAKTERATCDFTLTMKEGSQKLVDMLGLQKTSVSQEKANNEQCYGHVLRRNSDDALKTTLFFK